MKHAFPILRRLEEAGGNNCRLVGDILYKILIDFR